MSGFHYGRRAGYRAPPPRQTFEGTIGTRVPMRDGPTLAEQLAAEFKGDTLEQMCLGKGGTLTCNDYWGLRRYLLPDQSVVVLQKLGGQAMTVDATDSESIKAYCQAFRFDAREVNFFAYMVLSEAAITKAKNEARGTSRSPM